MATSLNKNGSDFPARYTQLNNKINTLSGKTVVLKKVFGLNDPPLPSLYMLPKNSGKKIVNIHAK
jgi:hypothetical protein